MGGPSTTISKNHPRPGNIIFSSSREIIKNTQVYSRLFRCRKNKFDFIYIDGNHLYEFVLKDILNSINCLNKNGIIVCDDFNSKGWWGDGVTKAVNEIVEKKKLKFLNHDEALIEQQSVLKME